MVFMALVAIALQGGPTTPLAGAVVDESGCQSSALN